MDKAICKVCGPKPISEFYRHAKRGYQSLCKQCKASYNKKHYRKNKLAYKNRALASNQRIRQRRYELIATYLREHPCDNCGESDPMVLEFHHKDPKEKVNNVSALVCQLAPWPAVLREIQKCAVLCANCHRRETAKQLGWRQFA